MDFNNITLDELDAMAMGDLKEVAKYYDIKIGNIGENKLREKIKDVIKDKSNTDVIAEDFDDDLVADDTDKIVESEEIETKSESLSDTLKSISDGIDDLDESSGDKVDEIVDLPGDTIIPVKSMTFGRLNYISRQTGAAYWWQNIGDVTNMSVSALIEMNNYNRDYLRQPMVILLDERAVKYFRLKEIYENVAKINNLKALFKKDINTITVTIESALKVGMRDILIAKVRTMYKNGALKDINIIRLLERKLQFDLSDDVQN